jgi:acyl phosphate:glycerol-3-phosphate acyltransferase
LRVSVAILVSYLLGSIPFGYLIVSAKTGGDIRQTGSGGTGATNVSRRAGKGAGVLTLILDATKGSVAVILAIRLMNFANQPGDSAAWWVGAAGIAAIVGHVFPVWLHFRGGKGVATGVGVFLVLAPLAVVAAGIIFVVIVSLSRYVSLGSVVGAASVPLFVWLESFFRPVPHLGALITTTLVGAIVVLFAHRGNISRLLTGSESKF